MIILPKQAGTEQGELLFHSSGKVQDFQEASEIVNSLKETIDCYGGVGLAAPQIGISKRILIVRFDSEDKEFINPQILDYSAEKNSDLEGCLSVLFGSFFGPVERSNSIKIQYFDVSGKEHTEEIEDPLLSRIIQHELDHLDGIIFLQRMKKEDFPKIYWDEERDIRKK